MDERMGPLLDELNTHRERYKAFCRSLSAEELDLPVPASVWTTKGYIIHLATIDKTVAPWFQSQLEGAPPPPPPSDGQEGKPKFDVDAWNEAQVAKRMGESLEDILSEMDESRAVIVKLMEQFDEKVLDGTMSFPGDKNRPPSEVNFYQYLRAWVRHDPAHAGDMLRAMPERRKDPVIAEWLDAVRYDDLDKSIVPNPPKV